MGGGGALLKKEKKMKTNGGGIPFDLLNLELYRADKKLCSKWNELVKVWSEAYPGVDVLQEVRSAHAWEVENPKNRKVDRPRFLGNWLRRRQDQPRQSTHFGANRPGFSVAQPKEKTQNVKRDELTREVDAWMAKEFQNETHLDR